MSAVQYKVSRNYFLFHAVQARLTGDDGGLKYCQRKLRFLRRLRCRKG